MTEKKESAPPRKDVREHSVENQVGGPTNWTNSIWHEKHLTLNSISPLVWRECAPCQKSISSRQMKIAASTRSATTTKQCKCALRGTIEQANKSRQVRSNWSKSKSGCGHCLMAKCCSMATRAIDHTGSRNQRAGKTCLRAGATEHAGCLFACCQG